MSVFFCPIANVNAPLRMVWSFLAEPANYALWWDAHTRSISPAGAAQPGQQIMAQSSALGREWPVNILVEGVDDTKHQLDLKSMLPLGITVFNHITCTALNPATTQVTFG